MVTNINILCFRSMCPDVKMLVNGHQHIRRNNGAELIYLFKRHKCLSSLIKDATVMLVQPQQQELIGCMDASSLMQI